MSVFGIKQWVSMFESVGLDRAGRREWHRIFEERHPEVHRRFLEWLGLDADHIGEVRRGK